MFEKKLEATAATGSRTFPCATMEQSAFDEDDVDGVTLHNAPLPDKNCAITDGWLTTDHCAEKVSGRSRVLRLHIKGLRYFCGDEDYFIRPERLEKPLEAVFSALDNFQTFKKLSFDAVTNTSPSSENLMIVTALEWPESLGGDVRRSLRVSYDLCFFLVSKFQTTMLLAAVTRYWPVGETASF
jgi:hypothetical protein